MDIQQHQNMRDDKEEKQRNQESDHQKAITNSASAASSTPPSPSSSSSSPSHEFSFTISFQQTKQIPPSSTTSSSSFAIDLSPADDIFFHGHLLPLHLLSHLSTSSPRCSTNSLDSFTLPKKDHFFDDHKAQNFKNQRILLDEDITYTSKGKQKAKSFSPFGLPNWRKEKENKERSQQYSKKMKFDVMTQVVKRYIRMVRPFLSFRNKKNMQFHRQSYSFSWNLLSSRGIKGQYSSAPSSMRTSPTNSGLLVATPTGGTYNSSSSSYSSDSTMEELQAAIQAAIAHCKKSISMEEKIK